MGSTGSTGSARKSVISLRSVGSMGSEAQEAREDRMIRKRSSGSSGSEAKRSEAWEAWEAKRSVGSEAKRSVGSVGSEVWEEAWEAKRSAGSVGSAGSEAKRSEAKRSEAWEAKRSEAKHRKRSMGSEAKHGKRYNVTHTFKGLESVEEMTLSRCKLETLVPGALSTMHRMRHLEVTTYNGDWASLVLEVLPSSLPASMEWLSLAHNNIWTLPPRAFCASSASLVHLNLSHNHLQNFHDIGLTRNIVIDIPEANMSKFDHYESEADYQHNEAEDCVFNLQELVLDHNDLVSLPVRSFAMLNGLKRLHLRNNNIKTVSYAFENLMALKEIYLSNNYITSVQNGTLRDLLSLERLYLNNNSISTLHPDIFSGLSELQVINLSNNKLILDSNHDYLFRDLRRLVILDLSNNALTSISFSVFSDLTSLQQLDLSRNHIQYIEGGSFESLSNLYTIDLSNNNLHTLHERTFKGLAGAALINLCNNSIVEVHEKAFHFSYNLKGLNLGDNLLQAIPLAVGNLSFLKSLDISRNRIISIEPFQFDGLSNLQALNLSGNILEQLENTTLKGLNVISALDLNDNSISKIDEGVFLVSPNLVSLSIARNRLDQVNLLFAALENLRYLDLTKNFISMFDYAFIPRELNKLILKNNRLLKIGNHFKVHNYLTMEHIDVSYNTISVLDDLSLPDSIRTVRMNNNNLTSLNPNSFLNKTNIELIDLRMNHIQKLNPKALNSRDISGRRSSPEIFLSGNPLICDCEMEWLHGAVGVSKSHRNAAKVGFSYPKIIDVTGLTCSLPHSRGVNQSIVLKVMDTSPESFLCPYATHCFALCHCCSFIACDCQMKCPSSCSCFHDDLWSMNLVDCSVGNLSRLPELVPMDATVVLLDGNNLQTLHAHQFIGRHSIQHLFLNASQVTTLQNRSLHGLTSLISLHLQDNMILKLKGYEFFDLHHLKELYLQNNRISFINNATFVDLKSLEVLRLDNNFIVYFPVWIFSNNHYLNKVFLSGNPWDCNCDFVRAMQDWEKDQSQILQDPNDIFCVDSTSGSVGPSIILSDYVCISGQNAVKKYQFGQNQLPFVAGGLCGGIVLVSALVIAAMFIARRKASENNKLYNTSQTTYCHEVDHKVFDAYISYSSSDASFVRDVLASKLENSYPSYKLCLHTRDFSESSRLSEFIVQSVAFSRKTIFVISKNYVNNEWQNPIFKKSHMDALLDKEIPMISIYYDNNVSESDFDSELKGILRKSVKLKWGDKSFWKKLMEVMPDKRSYSSPVYIADNFYKIPQSLSTSSLTTPSQNIQFQNHTISKSNDTGKAVTSTPSSPDSYKAPPPPRPCYSPPPTCDYIVMQGRNCRDSMCSCQQHSHEAYTFVDGDGSFLNTYSALDSSSSEPHNKRRPDSTGSHHYSVIDGQVRHSLRGNKDQNLTRITKYGTIKDDIPSKPTEEHQHQYKNSLDKQISFPTQDKKLSFIRSRDSTLQTSRRSCERYSDYSTDHSSDRSSSRSFDYSMTTPSSIKHQSHTLYTGLAGTPPNMSQNTEECFV
ncbi:unnamed protein product, partial [Meganyctiphanes norvegica]